VSYERRESREVVLGPASAAVLLSVHSFGKSSENRVFDSRLELREF
jgi:hypothetical protein